MDTIRISSDIQQLTGEGEEYLVDKTGENVLAVFYNGNFIRPLPGGNSEITLANDRW